MIDKVSSQADKYPEIWNLRADLIEMALDGQTSAADQETARDDRLRYTAAALGAPPTTSGTPVALTTASQQNLRGSIQPGIAIWGRRAGAGESPIGVTVTAIAVDSSGNRRIILPGYALVDNGRTEYALVPSGPAVAYAEPSDLVAPDKDSKGSVLLARVTPNVNSSNTLADNEKLTEFGPIPPIGSDFKFFSNQALKVGVIAAIDGKFVVTDGRISAPGDGGAPVIDRAGHLFAMGYEGSEKESRFLSLEWLSTHAGLKLQK
jgi:hypothetical protein